LIILGLIHSSSFAEEVASDDPEEVASVDQTDLMSPSCGTKRILSAAKRYVKRRWKNRSHWGGQCGQAVREAVQSVGIAKGQSGWDAILVSERLPAQGFVKLTTKNVSEAPPGAIVIFAGPDSEQYLKTRKRTGMPAGKWAGHIMIKGDDGQTYTDGRIKRYAPGWQVERDGTQRNNAPEWISNGKGKKIRNPGYRSVYGIYVPGPGLNRKLCGAE